MKILITGKDGMLGSALVRSCVAQGIPHVAYGHKEMDITSPDAVQHIAKINDHIDVVINAAGAVRNKVGYLRYDFAPRDAAEQDGLMAYTNTVGPHILSANFAKVVQISTDCVFDGSEGPYDEQACPRPADLYGVSKLGGELRGRTDLTIRGSFVGFGEGSFLDRLIFSLDKGETIQGFTTWWWNGLYVDTFAAFVLQCARMDMTGLIHAVGPRITKWGLLQIVAKALRPDITVGGIGGSEKNMMLESNVIPSIHEIIGLDYKVDWNYMIERMKLDYTKINTHYSDDPGGAEPGE